MYIYVYIYYIYIIGTSITYSKFLVLFNYLFRDLFEVIFQNNLFMIKTVRVKVMIE